MGDNFEVHAQWGVESSNGSPGISTPRGQGNGLVKLEFVSHRSVNPKRPGDGLVQLKCVSHRSGPWTHWRELTELEVSHLRCTASHSTMDLVKQLCCDHHMWLEKSATWGGTQIVVVFLPQELAVGTRERESAAC